VKSFENFINGAWQSSQSDKTIDVSNPCSGEVEFQVAQSTIADVETAINSSFEALKSWKKLPVAERVTLQKSAAESMRQNIDLLAQTLAKELGRPIAACEMEIKRSADLLDFYAEEGKRLKGEIPLHNIEGEKALIIREPVGLVVAITPFNYPITLLCMKLGAALVAGCSVLSKPSEDTPVSTLLLAEIFSKAGLPDGVFNVITGYGYEIGNHLIEHPKTAKIAFTGGTSTGKRIGSLAAAHNKRVTLELGGQSPAIIDKDADLEIAVPAIVKHAFANSGQFCYRVNRAYVAQEIYASFCEKIKVLVDKLTLGNPFSGADMGPLVNEKIYRNSELQTEDAKQKGAKILTGGSRVLGDKYEKGWYFPPTVIIDTNHSMKIMQEETFGPVLGIMPFENLEQALTLANDCEYGLAAYVFTGNLGTGLRLAENLEAGSVWINNIHRSYHDVPFGGVKQSGIGREKGHYGIEAYTELKTIYLNY
jgi:succinate-semialdehyde dehydrogenase / glutarate-semialdehyde dehydrogenase